MQTPRKNGRPAGPRLALDVAVLNQLRAGAGLTLDELADRAGVGRLTLKANIAEAKTSRYVAGRLAAALDCDPEWLCPRTTCSSCGQLMPYPWEPGARHD